MISVSLIHVFFPCVFVLLECCLMPVLCCTIDGGLDREAGGQYPEDPRYPVPDGGLVYPPDGGVYGRLLGAPQSPYSVNGGVRASAEPLLPSDMYEEDQPPPPHPQHPQHPPAPPPHLSPPTPSLPPVQNHDNYAHPSRLRPPSTDSTAPRGLPRPYPSSGMHSLLASGSSFTLRRLTSVSLK